MGAMRKAELLQKSHERILGDGNFVVEALAVSQEQMEKGYRLRTQMVDLERIASRVI